MFAHSSTFWMRLCCLDLSSMMLRRYRTSSRSSRWFRFGMKLALSSPWRRSLAIHSESLTSVLRPGNAFICCAFTTRNSIPSASSRLTIGFQNTPVLSIATWEHSCCLIQSISCNRCTVFVENVWISFPLDVRIHAGMLSLWISIPHARSQIMKMECRIPQYCY